MINAISISFGASLGALLRYGVSLGISKFWDLPSFYATGFVNITGSLLIGFLYGLTSSVTIPSHIRLFIFVGFLGGYTTFSAFALEGTDLIKNGQINMCLSYLLISNFLGIAAVFSGIFVSHLFFKKA